MILSIEGAPASGKSTTCEHLVRRYGAVRIPEVNELFGKSPTGEPWTWYCERQLERCARARAADGPGRLVLLDGDPLQAVWYSWIYPERGFEPWRHPLAFFRARASALVVPSFHVHLWIDGAEHVRRERAREAARGHDARRAELKVRLYADFAPPQRAWFDALEARFRGFVLSCETLDMERTALAILGHEPPAAPDAGEFLDWMGRWLAAHPSAPYRRKPR
jgi:aromatic ring-cleaving dioxygenase